MIYSCISELTEYIYISQLLQTAQTADCERCEQILGKYNPGSLRDVHGINFAYISSIYIFASIIARVWSEGNLILQKQCFEIHFLVLCRRFPRRVSTAVHSYAYAMVHALSGCLVKRGTAQLYCS